MNLIDVIRIDKDKHYLCKIDVTSFAHTACYFDEPRAWIAITRDQQERIYIGSYALVIDSLLTKYKHTCLN